MQLCLNAAAAPSAGAEHGRDPDQETRTTATALRRPAAAARPLRRRRRAVRQVVAPAAEASRLTRRPRRRAAARWARRRRSLASRSASVASRRARLTVTVALPAMSDDEHLDVLLPLAGLRSRPRTVSEVGAQRDLHRDLGVAAPGRRSSSCEWYPRPVCSLGITSLLSSSARTKVWVSLISSTTPSLPSNSIRSPIRSGCVSAIRIPAAKLPSVPLRREAEDERRSPPRRRECAPATLRTCGMTSRPANTADEDDHRHDRPAQDAVARHACRRRDDRGACAGRPASPEQRRRRQLRRES